MRENYKIEKEFLFKNNIKDITSISLDSEHKVVGNEVIGNFLIKGDYKIHEVSLNREKFEYKIPFKKDILDEVDHNSIKLEITNFEYDFKKDELLVNIEYEISGDRKDVLIFDSEETLDDFLKSREIEIIDTRTDEDKSLKEEIEDKRENEIIVLEDKSNFELPNQDIDIREDEIKTEEIINNIEKPKDNFVTYKIYKIEESDTLESIMLKFKISLDELKEYNDLSNLKQNDKIIIPYYE